MKGIETRNFVFEKEIFDSFNKRNFWQLIAYSKDLYPNDKDLQINLLIDILAQKKDSDIVEFRIIQKELTMKAILPSLWAICYLLFDYVSDDSFTNYVNWLISEGEEKYNNLLQNPDSLIQTYPNKEELIGRSEKFYLISIYAYEKKHPESGDPSFDFSQLYYSHDKSKIIYPRLKRDWETKEDLKKKYPKFYNKFCI